MTTIFDRTPICLYAFSPEPDEIAALAFFYVSQKDPLQKALFFFPILWYDTCRILKGALYENHR